MASLGVFFVGLRKLPGLSGEFCEETWDSMCLNSDSSNLGLVDSQIRPANHVFFFGIPAIEFENPSHFFHFWRLFPGKAVGFACDSLTIFEDMTS